jgi:glucose-6-phosphate isomerase
VVVESVDAGAVGGAFTIAFAPSEADLTVEAPLGAQFIFWEWVTALVGAALEIDPFNQPNVTEAKEQTLALLTEWSVDGETSVPTLTPAASTSKVEIFGEGACLADALKAAIAATKSDGYIAITAYLDRKDDVALEELRALLSRASGRPVTFGWGPRFLHSTGQFHKAGQPNGTFIQLTSVIEKDISIPGREFTFGTLITAQALGDGRTLEKRQYPLLRLHLKERSAGIAEILEAARSL